MKYLDLFVQAFQKPPTTAQMVALAGLHAWRTGVHSGVKNAWVRTPEDERDCQYKLASLYAYASDKSWGASYPFRAARLRQAMQPHHTEVIPRTQAVLGRLAGPRSELIETVRVHGAFRNCGEFDPRPTAGAIYFENRADYLDPMTDNGGVANFKRAINAIRYAGEDAGDTSDAAFKVRTTRQHDALHGTGPRVFTRTIAACAAYRETKELLPTAIAAHWADVWMELEAPALALACFDIAVASLVTAGAPRVPTADLYAFYVSCEDVLSTLRIIELGEFL